MSRFTRQSDSADLLIALVGGIGAGIGLGLLLAPKSGRDLRADIDRTADAGVARVRKSIEDFKAQAASIVEKGKATANLQKEGVGQAITAAQKAYREVTG